MAATGLVLVVLPDPGRAAAPSCQRGRYLVSGGQVLLTPRAGQEAAAAAGASIILLSGDQVSIAGVCDPTAAVLKETRRGTKVRGTWKSCRGVKGPVRLSATIGGESCRSLVGQVRARRGRLRQRFRATFSLVGAGSCDAESTFEHIQKRIIGPRGCRVDACHGSGKAGGLDLRYGLAHDALAGAAATNAAAAAAGKQRVVAGDPDASFLIQKVSGDLGPDEGKRMPEVGRPLDTRELDLLRAWIRAGAPATGKVADAPCLPPDTFHAAPPLLPPPGGYQIAFEGPVMQPGEELEACVWIRVPNTEDFTVGRWEYSLNPGTHHFALWDHVNGAEPATGSFRRDVACIAGGARPDGVTISGAPEAPYFVESYPAGVGRIVKGGQLMGINPHYHNEFDVPVQIKGWINMHPVDGPLRHLAEGLVSTNARLDGKNPYSIFVPPFSTATLRLRYGPTDEAWSIFRLSGHEHQRGTRFTAWKSDGTKLFDNLDWSHPASFDYDPPLVLQPGDYIEYECEHDNGVTRPVRRCGDSPNDSGCTPGEPIASKFGLTSLDEMCLLVGMYYTE